MAWAYVRYGALPTATAILYGVKPVVIAVVAQALWRLGRTALKTPALAVLGALAVAAVVGGVHEPVVLAGSALLMATRRWWPSAGRGGHAAAFVGGTGALAGAAGLSAAGASAATAPGVAVGLWPLFLVFAKTGAVLFGSGCVLLAFLRADLVTRFGWLTERQLLDAVAVGQITPGPVFTTATFVGYLLGGTPGAAVATIGIFLPAFVFVAISGPLVPRLRRSPVAAAALDGVNVASLALMAVVSWQLGRAALIDPITIGLSALSLLALVRFRVNSAWLVLGGGVVGWLAHVW